MTHRSALHKSKQEGSGMKTLGHIVIVQLTLSDCNFLCSIFFLVFCLL